MAFGRSSRGRARGERGFGGRIPFAGPEEIGPKFRGEDYYAPEAAEKNLVDPVQGQLWRVRLGEDVTMELVPVRAGKYRRGSRRWFAGEKPQHWVLITHSFWMAKYPITQRQYELMGEENPAHFRREDRPVEMVSWYDARAWCKKLTERERGEGRLPEGYVYRLPTEGEWEYAARGGNFGQGYKYSGSNNIEDVAWYGGPMGGNSAYMSSPVGLKAPNKLGLYDMSGNVWEWCRDWQGDYPRTDGLVNPTGPKEGSHRLLRGGSWGYEAGCCLVSNRDGLTPEHVYADVGFRVVLGPDPKFFKRPARPNAG